MSLIVMLLVLLVGVSWGCVLHGMSGFSSISCCDWWYACSLCTVWVLSPFLSIFFTYALSGLFLWLHFFIGLHPVCCMYYDFSSILHIILHGLPFGFCFLFLFFLLLYGVYFVGIMGFVWWEVLFCCICTTTSLSIPCSPYNVYSSIFFLSCFVCLFLLSHMPLVLFFLSLCVFYPCLDENFWGVYAYALYAAMDEFRNMHTKYILL